jgi:drug/metabolite transporter (DMT)-like permease
MSAVLATSFLLSAGLLAWQQGHLPGLRLLPLLMLAGMLDTFGNVFFVLAGRHGRLDVAAVLSSLYPATTVLLARLVLKERITGLQATGIAAALVAVPLIVG